MEGQMTTFDFPGLIPDDFKNLESPPFDVGLLKSIKGLSDITPTLPKYKIVLKNPDYAGRKEKIAVWVTYFHSIDDSGWNYDLKDIERYEEIQSSPMYAWWIWSEKKWKYFYSQEELREAIAQKMRVPLLS